MSDVITTLVGEELEGGGAKWLGTLAAPNGYLYGIPNDAPRVAKFNPVDKSITEIGPDFGRAKKWYNGAMTDNGIIYCPPYDSRNRGILKIDTNTDNVTELDRNLLPERGDWMWVSCALALDGCIYFMPADARRIMKLDPNNNDAMSSVGKSFGYCFRKYKGTVVGIDGCVYGIPYNSKRIVKYDPINDITSRVGEVEDEHFKCDWSGALGRDGCIYVLVYDGPVLKIDTVNNSHCAVGVDDDDADMVGDAILGIDGCIYWPPCDTGYTLKYDPHSKQFSRVGDYFETEEGVRSCGWSCGALANDGVIYCIPSYANQVLAIDPIGEFLATTKTVMQDHPEEFGYLFQTIEADEDSDEEDSSSSLTNFNLAVVKFGQNIVFDAMEKSMKPVNDYCKESNLCPFMIVASCKDSPVCVINHLLRRDLSWMNSCTISSLECNAPKNKKIRIK